MLVNAFKWKLKGAFAALYLIWGSTYLAIRFALETLPPFTMSGARFVVGGLILYGWARLRGAASPVLKHWPPAMGVIISAVVLIISRQGQADPETLLQSEAAQAEIEDGLCASK